MAKDFQSNTQNTMKIGQLAALSGVNRSSIHHYLNLGLLPKPETAGLNIHLYGKIHLVLLREIKKLRDEKKMSLAEIRDWVDQRDWSDPDQWPVDALPEIPKEPDPALEPRKTSDIKRKQIIKTATDLFSRLGYEAVRISDITDALRMSKATFYEYFQGKEQLFMECIERLVVAIVPREKWYAIREEEDYFERQRLRAREFLKSFPGYSGVLQQARIFSMIGNPELAAKAKATFKILADPLTRDIEYAQARGMLRPFNPETGAHFLLGLAEGIGWKLITEPGPDIDQVVTQLIDLIRFGLSPRPSPEDDSRPEAGFSMKVLDVQGIETWLNAPRFDGRDFLEGTIGAALARVELNNVTRLRVERVAREGLELSITAPHDQAMTLLVNRAIEVSGATPFGRVVIPLEKVAQIIVENDPPP